MQHQQQPTQRSQTKRIGGYALIKKLGHGSFATVYMGVNDEGGTIAVKAIKTNRYCC